MLSIPYVAQLIQVVLQGTPFPHVDRAIPLLLGVAVQESGLRSTRQLGHGPARGYWQMEPVTERDHWRWLQTNPPLLASLHERCGVDEASAMALQHNLPYQVLMARLHFYLRDPQPLPAPDDLINQARCWKTYYNTDAGKGTIAAYIEHWNMIVRPVWSP